MKAVSKLRQFTQVKEIVTGLHTFHRHTSISYFRPISALCALLLLGLSSFNIALPAHAASTAPTIYKLLWSDDFTGKKGALPSTKFWSPEVGGLNQNGELEFYTKDSSNIGLDGKGHLVITANRIADQSMIAVKSDPKIDRMLNACNACQFSSAKIKSAGKISFQYGRMEIRVKAPVGEGTWPAFWMLGNDLIKGVPWPDAGEIDIWEARGSQPQLAFGTIHGPGMVSSGGGYGATYDNQNSLATGYHTYAIEWKKNQIDFLVDDEPYFTAKASDKEAGTWVYNQPFFLILNLAMGGQFTGDIDPALMQAQMYVDYIRFYSINGVGKVLTK